MKRLNITNFTQRMDDIYSDFFEIKYSTQDADKYIIGIVANDVVSFKPSPGYNYMMAIYKDRMADSLIVDSYGIKLWDMGENITYPMSVDVNSLKSLSLFTTFLNHTLKLASEGSFSGTSGNGIEHNYTIK
jgi:hypothetical protein